MWLWRFIWIKVDWFIELISEDKIAKYHVYIEVNFSVVGWLCKKWLLNEEKLKQPSPFCEDITDQNCKYTISHFNFFIFLFYFIYAKTPADHKFSQLSIFPALRLETETSESTKPAAQVRSQLDSQLSLTVKQEAAACWLCKGTKMKCIIKETYESWHWARD